MGARGAQLVGRDAELAEIDAALDAGRTGLVGLELWGDAGIGKTMVWREAIRRAEARGVQVLRCRPSAAEIRLSYSALTDLLAPIAASSFAGLPAPQRLALDVVLLRAAEGSGGAEHADRRTVATAVLSLLIATSANTPLAIMVDDVQWLDGATARVLEFALRRLGDHPVTVVSTRRTQSAGADAGLSTLVPEEHLRRLQLDPLSLQALHTVIRDQLGTTLPRPLLVRVHRASLGNSLHALEIVRSIKVGSPGEVGGHDLGVPADLGVLVARRFRRLPKVTRDALLSASALASPTTALVSEEALRAAVEAGLVRIEQEAVSFVHPLYAAVVYGSARGPAKRALHARLATELADTVERALHLALASTTADELVARALDAGVAKALERGALDMAAELAERSAQLTPRIDQQGRCTRLTAAGRLWFQEGDWGRAQALVERALDSAPPGRPRGEALHLMAQIRYSTNDFAEAAALLESALWEDGDPAFVAAVMVDRSFTLFSAGDLRTAMECAAVAAEAAAHQADTGLLAQTLALVGMGDGYTDPGAGLDTLARAVALEDRRRYVPIQLRPSWLEADLLFHVGHLNQARAKLDELRAWLVERGLDSELPWLLWLMSELNCLDGDTDGAMRMSGEALMLAEQASSDMLQGLSLVHRGRALAIRGEVAHAYSTFDRAAAHLTPTGWAVGWLFLIWARGFLDLSLGERERAASTYELVVAALEPVRYTWWFAHVGVTDAVESLVGVGQIERADRLLAVHEEAIVEAGVRAAGPVLRARSAILAAQGDLAGALAVAERSVDIEVRRTIPLELARTLLVKGQLERRLKKRAAARTSLGQALATCERIGAPLWAAQARAELDRLGRRTAPTALTATEERIAHLAASGQTNNEIAAQLFLSRRTVESNLARAYQKLGIRSRAQLAVALTGNRHD